MKRKSKLVVFLLSVIPGLSHFYLGLMYRGYIFLGAAAANVFVVMGLTILMHNDDPLVLLLGLPIIWFAALVDSIMLTDRVNMKLIGENNNGELVYHGEEQIGKDYSGDDMKVQNKKILTCLFSVVPGAGHMYLGYQKQGLELMTLFFFSFFFIDWLRISFFMFTIPVIWFYSMFDALGKVSREETMEDDKYQVSLFDFIKDNSSGITGSKVLGFGLVGIGLLLIFDRIISPLITYQVRNYLQTGIVSFLFIFGGIRILLSGRRQDAEAKEKEGEEKCEDVE
ncbi:MAG: hypothetical protein HPY66_0907 [Firmicutes bacterium]|nr:hypothetical protein [Bacillota bacterium]MDI6705804.1 hypothetical protein [Bacillota bacterium]